MDTINITPKKLYNLPIEEILKLNGYILNSLRYGVLKQILIKKEYIIIKEEGSVNWYPYYKEDGTRVERVASYKHECTYYFDEVNKLVKSEEYEYYINSIDEECENLDHGFGAYIKEVVDLEDEEDYSEKENCTTIQDFWEIIRDEFIDTYHDEWDVFLYDSSLMKVADENFTE